MYLIAYFVFQISSRQPLEDSNVHEIGHSLKRHTALFRKQTKWGSVVEPRSLIWVQIREEEPRNLLKKLFVLPSQRISRSAGSGKTQVSGRECLQDTWNPIYH